MVIITSNTLKKIIADSFTTSIRKMNVNDIRYLRFKDFYIAVERDTVNSYVVDMKKIERKTFNTNNEAKEYIFKLNAEKIPHNGALLEKKADNIFSVALNTVKKKKFTFWEDAKECVSEFISASCSITGTSLEALKKAINNIINIKHYLYLREFFENGCSNGYDTYSIHHYNFIHEALTDDNILDITEQVLRDVSEKTHNSFMKVSSSALAKVGLGYENFEKEVFNNFNPIFPKWSIYGQYGLCMNEVELPFFCKELLNSIYDLICIEEKHNNFKVVAHDLSDYSFNCYSEEMMELVVSFLNTYSVFEGDKKLYSI